MLKEHLVFAAMTIPLWLASSAMAQGSEQCTSLFDDGQEEGKEFGNRLWENEFDGECSRLDEFRGHIEEVSATAATSCFGEGLIEGLNDAFAVVAANCEPEKCAADGIDLGKFFASAFCATTDQARTETTSPPERCRWIRSGACLGTFEQYIECNCPDAPEKHEELYERLRKHCLGS